MKLAFLFVACLLFAAPSFDRITVPAGDGPGSVASPTSIMTAIAELFGMSASRAGVHGARDDL
jgi:hypothetical protein